MKIKVFLHMTAIIILYFLTRSFSDTAIQIGKAGSSVPFWQLCLSAFSVVISALLYTKYILKKGLSEFYFGKPYGTLRWGMAAVLIVAFLAAAYLLVPQGALIWGGLSAKEQSMVVYSEICKGLRASLGEGMLFCGLAFGIFTQRLGKRAGILLTGVLYALAALIPDIIYIQEAELWELALSVFLKGTVLALITYETGSIWSSVWLQMIFNILFVNSQILTLNSESISPGLWYYTLEEESWFWTGIPGLNDLETAGIVMLALLLTGILAGCRIRKKENRLKGEGYGTLRDTDH